MHATGILGVLLAAILVGVIYERRMARHDRERFPPPGRLVEVGGHRLHIHCSGAGGPMVVMDAGLGDSSQVWAEVHRTVSARTRACIYDRAGLGWSEPGQKPRTYQKAAEELQALLAAAGERPPYVLVGHSAGVNTVRLYAATFPDEVAGLVLIETPILPHVPNGLVTVLRAARLAIGALARMGAVRLLGRLGWMGVLFGGPRPPRDLSERAGFLYRPQNIRTALDESDAIRESLALVNASAGPGVWRDWPVVILAAQGGRKVPQLLDQSLQQLARQSTRGRVVYVRSSHFIHFELPDVVCRTILDVVDIAGRGAAASGVG